MTTTLDVELAEAGDLAGAPLDLLLTDAVKGNWQRFAPDTTVLRTAGRLANRPRKLLGRVGGLAGELGRVAAGRSRLEPDAKDRRFADQAWSRNWLLHRVLQAHLATRRTAEALVEDARLPEQDRLRMTTLVSNVANVLAPATTHCSTHSRSRPRSTPEGRTSCAGRGASRRISPSHPECPA